MGKSIFDFQKENVKKAEKVEEKTNLHTDNINPDIKDSYDKYKNLNENELESELFKQVQKNKQDGTFDMNFLKESIEKLSPYLPKENLENIKQTLEKMK